MELVKLEIKLGEKTYQQRGVTARKVIEFYDLQIENEKDISDVERLKNTIDYVVSLFDDEAVTKDAILDGLQSNELMPVLTDVMSNVMGGNEDDEESDPKKEEKE